LPVASGAAAAGTAALASGAVGRGLAPVGAWSLFALSLLASGAASGLASADPLLAKVEPCASEAAIVAPSLLKRVVARVADCVQVR